nr:MAG TPA: hypothetical protein [Caudoviricetes sp.]
MCSFQRRSLLWRPLCASATDLRVWFAASSTTRT